MIYVRGNTYITMTPRFFNFLGLECRCRRIMCAGICVRGTHRPRIFCPTGQIHLGISVRPDTRGPTPIECAYEIYKSHDLKVDL